MAGNPNSGPPFLEGKAAAQGGGPSGAHNFNQDPTTESRKAGAQARDFTKESRAQSEAKPEVTPNPQSIPQGGKTLYADPGKVSGKIAGQTDQGRKPFKVGK